MGKPHVLVFPIPLQGHINPMMTLSRNLHNSGIEVTFLLTERSLSRIYMSNTRMCNIHNNSSNSPQTTSYHMKEDSAIQKIALNYELHHQHPSTNRTHLQYNISNKDEKTVIEVGNIFNNLCIHGERNHNSVRNDATLDGCIDAYTRHATPVIQFETLPDSVFPLDQSTSVSDSALIFLESMPLIRRKMEEILESLQRKGHPVTCIISDSFVPWTQDVANKFGIPRIEFWSSSARVYSMGYHIPQLISEGYLPVPPGKEHDFCIDIIPGLAPFRLVDFFYTHPISSPVFDLVRNAFTRAKEARRVLVNSFYEFEKDIIDGLHKEGILIEPIGPLIPYPTCRHRAMTTENGDKNMMMSMSLYADDTDCLVWLDTQEKGSVIYVSFGSMVSLDREELQELILGLEGSELPYLLVVRPDMPFKECKRTKGRGKICSWAPQGQVLAHPAVSGFLTHCGWNSIMEGICSGVPMIGCPRESEQHTNLKCLMDEWKVAIRLDHKEDSRVEPRHCKEPSANRPRIQRGPVERAVRSLMQEDVGAALRERMRTLQRSALLEARRKAAPLGSLVADL
ncbi:hypothetical protein KP509_02G108500 [Ceratopteris richardii]|uniref:Glycosyltransferase n=1 Tax=Ceratopteris richardii TaxID=49495 RepID=A0A8T2V9H4_CERRI|nr:hypothetical protein KP509_02G108500 [Ceratopteris richardii]